MNAIELRSAYKRFGSTTVLQGLDLSVPDGSITAILGPSGSGKTTLLRIIAGFEQLDAGELEIAGQLMGDTRRHVRPQQRGVGYVPQEGALFPHLTVLGNIAFGISRTQRPRARELAGLVGLGELQDRYPHQLSGGQQQRVALARALAIQPRVVLLDEPFGSLDASLRLELRDDVTRIIHGTGTTAVLVTHDQDEALAAADQIALVANGQIIAHAPPRLLYHDPPNLAAALSLGEASILEVELRAGQVAGPLGAVPLRHNGSMPADGRYRLLLRPEQIAIHTAPQLDATEVIVDQVRFHGHETLVNLRLPTAEQTRLIARAPGNRQLQAGQTVWVTIIDPGAIWPATAP